MSKFFSQFEINEEVEFRPMYRHQQAMSIADEEIDGRIVAVRFTEMKVFYDVLSTYHGQVFDNVDSAKVSKPVMLPLPGAVTTKAPSPFNDILYTVKNEEGAVVMTDARVLNVAVDGQSAIVRGTPTDGLEPEREAKTANLKEVIKPTFAGQDESEQAPYPSAV